MRVPARVPVAQLTGYANDFLYSPSHLQSKCLTAERDRRIIYILAKIRIKILNYNYNQICALKYLTPPDSVQAVEGIKNYIERRQIVMKMLQIRVQYCYNM